MNGITELQIYYILLSLMGFAFIFGIFLGVILRVFKRFVR
jgi:hypothetical protein